MLPESQDARALYSSIRENRSRWRIWRLDSSGGDMATLRPVEFSQLALEAEFSSLREITDFMESEEMLSVEQLEAVDNIIQWGIVLKSLIPSEFKEGK